MSVGDGINVLVPAIREGRQGLSLASATHEMPVLGIQQVGINRQVTGSLF